ncbi:MAG: hypothetical protein U5L96_05655 [Owenweeksia sp.]|nr:hypothetical protein [Owenweeksia sp.]
MGEVSDLAEITRIFSADEVIFCSRDISGNDIFRQMTALNPLK